MKLIDKLKSVLTYTSPVLNIYPAANYSGGRKGYTVSVRDTSVFPGSVKLSGANKVTFFMDVGYTGDSVEVTYNIANFLTTYPKFVGVPVKSILIE
jgi:hypothetical protein